MRRSCGLVVAGLLSLGTASSASADDATTDHRYPRRVIDRPLGYPKGVFALGTDVVTPTSSLFDPAILDGFAGYGIGDDLEVQFGSYAFPTDDVGAGSIDLGLGYNMVRDGADGKLEMIARASTGYTFGEQGGVDPLSIGVQLRYRVTPNLAVLTPSGQLVPGFAAFTAGLAPIAPVGQINVTLDDRGTGINRVTFDLPIALGYQLAPTVYAELDTLLASINIADSQNAYLGKDVTPVRVVGVVNVMPSLDVTAMFGSVDLTPPVGTDVSDTLYAGAGIRFYGGL